MRRMSFQFGETEGYSRSEKDNSIPNGRSSKRKGVTADLGTLIMIIYLNFLYIVILGKSCISKRSLLWFVRTCYQRVKSFEWVLYVVCLYAQAENLLLDADFNVKVRTVYTPQHPLLTSIPRKLIKYCSINIITWTTFHSFSIFLSLSLSYSIQIIYFAKLRWLNKLYYKLDV